MTISIGYNQSGRPPGAGVYVACFKQSEGFAYFDGKDWTQNYLTFEACSKDNPPGSRIAFWRRRWGRVPKYWRTYIESVSEMDAETNGVAS